MEKKLAERGKIPSRGEILCLMDFTFFRWGDRLFLTIMDSAIAVMVVAAWPLSWMAWVISAGMVLIWTIFWHFRWVNRTKVFDSLYPARGKTSLVGWAHLPYLWLQYFFGLVSLWALLTSYREVSPWVVIWGVVGVVAAACYFWTLLWVDRKAGRLVL